MSDLKKTPAPIIYQDDHLLAFDKPSGMLLIPDRREKGQTSLTQWVGQSACSEYAHVHRIDRGVSGIILFARKGAAMDFMGRQFSGMEVEHRCLVLVRGFPEKDEVLVDHAIASDFNHPGRMRLGGQDAKSAATLFRVIEKWRGYTLMEAFPRTSVAHQIQLHVGFLGCSIVGDSIYGDDRPVLLSELKPFYKHKGELEEKPLLGRLAIHSESIKFLHPGSQKEMTLKSEMPHDFEVTFKYLRRFS